MITLYGFGPAFGLLDPSPFVVKAHLLLKMAGLAYDFKEADLGKAPKGKIPYLVDDGETIPDSTLIRWHIEQKYGFDFNKGLSASERGIAHAFARLWETDLYFFNVDERWMDDANFAKGPAMFFAKVPAPLRPIIIMLVRRKVRHQQKAQGVGRYTTAEKRAMVAAGVAATAGQLGDKPFMMGEAPTAVDATIYAFMASMATPFFTTPYQEIFRDHPSLTAYLERMNARFALS